MISDDTCAREEGGENANQAIGPVFASGLLELRLGGVGRIVGNYVKKEGGVQGPLRLDAATEIAGAGQTEGVMGWRRGGQITSLRARLTRTVS